MRVTRTSCRCSRRFRSWPSSRHEYGSLIKGQIFGARERKRRGEVAKDRAPKFSFDDGLQVLPDTLAERLGDGLRLKAQVSKLVRTGSAWTLHFREQGREVHAEHSAVIYCGTAYGLADLEVLCDGAALPRGPENGAAPQRRPAEDTELHALDLAAFSEIRYPPVASVVLGFRREDVAHPCEGFGMLIPKIEGFQILGTIFSSSLFPNRAPAGHLTLTSYVGGERYPELASLSADKLYALTCDDLRVLLGVRGRPTFQHCVFYPKAIPQYNLGYGRYRELMTELEAKASGLFFAGHYRDGISLSDSIVSGCNVADRVAGWLNHETHETHERATKS